MIRPKKDDFGLIGHPNFRMSEGHFNHLFWVPCTSFTGGTVGALDYYSVNDLVDGYQHHVFNSNKVYHFKFDETATDAEDTTTHPYKVRPDDYVDAGVWIEQEPDFTDTLLFENVFFPDPEATDQGAADATYTSLKDIVDDVGTSEKATIVFRHDGSGNTTTYTLSTDETITSNITVIMEPGAIIDRDNALIDIKGPFFAMTGEQCFSGTVDKTVFEYDSVERVYPQWFGADETGAADSAGAINDAIYAAQYVGWVYLMPSVYLCNTRISIDYANFRFSGAGDTTTKLLFDKDTWTDTAANGCVEFSGHTYNNSIIENIRLDFDQPDTDTLATIVSSGIDEDAIYASGQPRIQINNVLITKAYNGISLDGNCGGSYIQNCKISAFNYGIELDGAAKQDTIRIDKLHYWPFGDAAGGLLNANHTTLFYTSTGIYIDSQMDDLKVTDSLFISSVSVKVDVNASSIAQFTGCSFDTRAEFQQLSGTLVTRISNSYFSIGENGHNAIDFRAGQMMVSNCHFIGSTMNDSLIYANTSTQTALHINNCHFNTAANDFHSIYATSSNKLYVKINNNTFYRTASASNYNNAIIDLDSNIRGSVCDNSTLDKGAGTGTFIDIANDDHITVVGNTGVGYAINVPSSHTSMGIGHNIETTNTTVGTLGAWSSSTGTVVNGAVSTVASGTATTDMWISCYIICNSNGDRGYVRLETPNNTLISNQYAEKQAGVNLPGGTAAMVVRKGDTWQVRVAEQSGSGTVAWTVNQIPFY